MTAIESLPSVILHVGDAIVDAVLMARIVEFEIVQSVNAPASCELELSDPDGRALLAFSKGLKLAVRVGDESRCIFEGTIAAIELEARGAYLRTIRVLAYDALDELRKGSPVRVHSNVTFADLARELTAAIAVALDVKDPGPVQARVVQHRRSDLDLLLAVAEREGIYVWLDGKVLRSCRVAALGPSLVRELGVDLREAKVVLSDATATSSVNVRGWDPHVVRERSGRVDRPSERRGDVTITNVVLSSDRQADHLARSQVERRMAATAVLYAVAEGDPALAPGVCVEIKNLPDAYAGPFRITSARHSFSPAVGYIVELSSALPPPHAPLAQTSAMLGVVAEVRDPSHLGRVKVRYPAVDDAESDWLQVLAAGAGGKKGLVALPTPGDRVLVLGLDDDPAHGIIVGALYGEDGLPGDRERPLSGYALLSPGGHVIELDDNASLTLRTPGGTSLELGRKQSTLHSTTDLRIEAPGKTISIAAAHVEFEKA